MNVDKRGFMHKEGRSRDRNSVNSVLHVGAGRV